MFIDLEDVVPNSLIEILENDIAKEVSFPILIQYGQQIVEELAKKGINATMLFYKEKNNKFKQIYKDVFDFYSKGDMLWVKCKPNITSKYLREHFRAYQNIDKLEAMVSTNSIKVIKKTKNI